MLERGLGRRQVVVPDSVLGTDADCESFDGFGNEISKYVSVSILELICHPGQVRYKQSGVSVRGERL